MSIDASSVDPFSLPSLPVSRRLSLPDCPAVYFALSGDDEILYVGRSISLLKRWKGTHERKGALEESNRGRVAWLVIENVEALAEIEEAFIERFRPPLNGSPIHREPEVWEVWEYQPEDSGELCGPDLDAELNAQIDRLNGLMKLRKVHRFRMRPTKAQEAGLLDASTRPRSCAPGAVRSIRT